MVEGGQQGSASGAGRYGYYPVCADVDECGDEGDDEVDDKRDNEERKTEAIKIILKIYIIRN